MINIPMNESKALTLGGQPEVNRNNVNDVVFPQRSKNNQNTGVRLRKGQRQSLNSLIPNLKEIQVCLSWDFVGISYDLDVSAFLLGSNERVISDDWFVYYFQKVSPDNSVIYLQDSRDGKQDGDDEIIKVNFQKLDSRIQKIVFVVTINDEDNRGYNFSNVSNAVARVVDLSNNREVLRFELTDYYSNVRSMVIGEVYKKNNEWRFNPVGDGIEDNLYSLCGRYGVNVSD